MRLEDIAPNAALAGLEPSLVSMLPRRPLCIVQADDPGAGKTVIAGFHLRELIVRNGARRLLVAAPGSLVDQWRVELHSKFGLTFTVYSKGMAGTSPSGNPFVDYDQLIIRLDQTARRLQIRERLPVADWDLVIVDDEPDAPPTKIKEGK